MPVLKRYDKNFFKRWTRDMAYVLGFLFADGNVVRTRRGTHFIALYIADKELLVQIQRSIKSNHKISARQSSTGYVYRLQIGSRELFDDVCTLGLCPGKTHRMQLPPVPTNYLGDFVRGYFDGDGNVWAGYINQRRPTPTYVLQASFTSSSRAFLAELRATLHTLGIVGGGLYTVKQATYSRLTLSTHDALKLYKIMYNSPCKLFLERKKRVFERFAKKQSVRV